MSVKQLLATAAAFAAVLSPVQQVLAATEASTQPAAVEQAIDSAQPARNAKPITDAQATRRPRVGIAFGGGGARGAAEAGVLKVLVEEKIPIDIVVGTSIGSVVGGLYCAGLSPDEIGSQFSNSTLMKAFMPMPIVLRIALAPVIFTPRLFGYHPYDGLYKGKKARQLIETLLPKPDEKIEDLKIPFSAMCTNLVSGRSQRLSSGAVALAMQASTSVPGIKKPVQIGNDLLCDGGLVCNLPVKQARDMGADFVIAIDINEYLNDVPLDTFRKAGSVTKQVLRIQLAHGDRASVESADVVIHPNADGIGLISKSKKDGQRGIEAGIRAAKAAIPEIRRKLAEMNVVTATGTQGAI